MTQEMAASVLALIIFAGVVYVLVQRTRKGRWPKLRNPFYYE